MNTEGTRKAITSYRIDATRSRFFVRASATGMLSAFGHNPTIAIRDFSGEAQAMPDTLEGAQIRIRINAAAFKVADDINEHDRLEIEKVMNEQVLEITEFPQITYESNAIASTRIFEGQYRINMSGKLFLHGVTRDFPVEAQLTVSEDSIRARGEFTVLLTDFRIRTPRVAGGAISLKNEVKSSFDIVAGRKAAEQ